MIYKFTGETKRVDGHVLNRIVATCDFRVANFDISKGHVGGWIEKRENLQGKAWVDDDAMVYDDAVVSGDAFVCHNAKVYNRATAMLTLVAMLLFVVLLSSHVMQQFFMMPKLSALA